MEQRLQLQQKQTQRLIITLKMQQSIHLLQLSTLELQDLVTNEIVENPLLEEIPGGETVSISEDSTPELPPVSETTEAAIAAASDGSSNGETKEFDSDWENYFVDSSDIGYVPSLAGRESEELETFEAPVVQQTSLKDHLLWQLEVETDTDQEYRLGEVIIDSLDDDGYLGLSVEEIADREGVTPEEVERVRRIFHNFDPVGIAAKDLAECLEIQFHAEGWEDTHVLECIRHHLPDLERKRYTQIARSLGVSVQRVQEMADEIGRLEPRPGRAYSPPQNEYITPDVFVEKVDGEWQVRLNDDGAPPLRISSRYRKMLENRESLSREEYEFLKTKFTAAKWLLSNIEQRKRTIYRVTKCIVDMQKDFLEQGITALKPMRLRDVADIVGVHEATVCRVVNKKYVQTPRGLFELKSFFSTGLDGGADAEDASAKSVMEQIKHLIDEEDPKKPLSDQRIAEILKARKINIARRTVAKYREKMGILPTSTRKRV